MNDSHIIDLAIDYILLICKSATIGIAQQASSQFGSTLYAEQPYQITA